MTEVVLRENPTGNRPLIVMTESRGDTFHLERQDHVTNCQSRRIEKHPVSLNAAYGLLS